MFNLGPEVCVRPLRSLPAKSTIESLFVLIKCGLRSISLMSKLLANLKRRIVSIVCERDESEFKRVDATERAFAACRMHSSASLRVRTETSLTFATALLWQVIS